MSEQNAYKKDGGSYNLPYSIPIDAPEFLRAKKAAEGSDVSYRWSVVDVIHCTDYSLVGCLYLCYLIKLFCFSNGRLPYLLK